LLKVYGSAVVAAGLAPGSAPVREEVKERRQCVLHSVHLNVSKATIRTANIMSVV